MPLTFILSVGLDRALLENRSLVLHSAGYMVVSAYSLKEAVDRFLGGDFDLVILCHSIPRKDRDHLACLIRASGSRIPVVCISGNPGQSDPFADTTIEDVPHKLLVGTRAVLLKSKNTWTVSPRGNHEATAPRIVFDSQQPLEKAAAKKKSK
jgi:hypothetical protein